MALPPLLLEEFCEPEELRSLRLVACVIRREEVLNGIFIQVNRNFHRTGHVRLYGHTHYDLFKGEVLQVLSPPRISGRVNLVRVRWMRNGIEGDMYYTNVHTACDHAPLKVIRKIRRQQKALEPKPQKPPRTIWERLDED